MTSQLKLPFRKQFQRERFNTFLAHLGRKRVQVIQFTFVDLEQKDVYGMNLMECTLYDVMYLSGHSQCLRHLRKCEVTGAAAFFLHSPKHAGRHGQIYEEEQRRIRGIYSHFNKLF